MDQEQVTATNAGILAKMNPRYELKYFVSHEQALRIRDFVREYLDFDGRNR